MAEEIKLSEREIRYRLAKVYGLILEAAEQPEEEADRRPVKAIEQEKTEGKEKPESTE